MSKNYFAVTFRAIRHTSVYSLLNIAGLALGIASAALIFLWVEDELSFDYGYVKHDQLYSIRMDLDYSGKIETFFTVPGPMPDAIRGTVPGLVNNSRTRFDRELFGLNDKTSYERGLYADTSIFSMLQLDFVSGNAAGFSNPYSLVLSEKMARKYFGNANPVGKTLRMNNIQDFVIIGVVRNAPDHVSITFNWIAPVSTFLDRNKWLQRWGTYGISTMVELSPGTDVNGVNRRLTDILRPKDPLYAHADCQLFSMNDWHLRNHFTNGQPDGGGITMVKLLATIASIILFIACINFMNLATARAGQRAREVGVRKTLGALRGSLIGQFLIETLVMSFMALALSVLLIYVFLPGFNGLVYKQLGFDLLTPAHLFGMLAIGIFCGLVAGSYPAFYLSSFQPVAVLKGQQIGMNNGAGFIRKALVVTQFTVSVILIVCTVIIYQQIGYIRARDLGYDKEHLIYTSLTDNLTEHFNAMKADLLHTGVVENAALTESPPLSMWSTTNSDKLTWEGGNPGAKIKINWEDVSPEYLPTMGLQLVAGRNFHQDIQSDSGNVIINQTLASLMGNAGRVGALLTYGDTNRRYYHVIGIVKDFLFNDLAGTVIPPLMMDCAPEVRGVYGFLTIRLKPGNDLVGQLAKVEAVTRANNPGYPVDYQFVDEQFNNMFEWQAHMGTLAGVFAVLAVLISCLGLFGLAAYTAERRTKEIGIRKVLGASVSGIAALLSTEFLQLVALSCLIAFPVAWWLMHGWLADFPYRTAIHWWVFGLAGIAAVVITLLTVSFQAIRAALSNPVKTLRTE
jgi:putative ABC transport system permease protein